MIFDLTTLMRAARLAREQSVSGKVIYITITEDGFIVQGQRGPLCAAIDVPWAEIDMNPGMIGNAVHLVARRLGE